MRSSFFAQRVVNAWNSLPSSVDFTTLSEMMRSLQCVNLNEFLTAYMIVDFIRILFVLVYLVYFILLLFVVLLSV